MRSKLVLDQDADASQLTALHPPVSWRKEKDGTLSAYFPKGSEFTGAQALALCQTGQATPADDECAKALGLSASQIEVLQVDYQMNNLGINSTEDRALFRAGVITGYDNKLNYKPGPNWDAYQAAKLANETEEDDV